jgi:cadmium resistance protein CadD (predicted permease)
MKTKFALSFLIIPFFLFAQIETKIDSSSILIGDQIKLSVKSNLNDLKNWKTFKDSIGKFEIISSSQIDTLQTDSGWILNQNYTLTHWDSGTFYIPSISMEEQTSDSILVYINTIESLIEGDIKGIKQPINTPISLKEILPYILIFLLILLVSLFIYHQLKNRKKTVKVEEKIEVIIPPFQIALNLLYKLKDKNLLKQNEVKEYHSQISEILRRYIENGLDLKAMELSSNEIVSSLKQQRIDTISIEKVFRISDLAKFAKFQPLEIENKECLEMAILFVEQTKPKQNELQ